MNHPTAFRLRALRRLLSTILLSPLLAGFVFSQTTPGTPPPAPSPAGTATDADDERETKAAAAATPAAPQPGADLYWESMKILRKGKGADLSRARAALQEAADMEFVAAESTLGLALLNGQMGFKKDVRKAASWFRLAAERGHAIGKTYLGLCYYDGAGVRRDRAKAAELFTAILAPNADFSRPTPPADFMEMPASDETTDGTLSGVVAIDFVDQCRALGHFFLGEIDSAANRLEQAHAHYVQAAAGRAGVQQAAIKAATNFAFGKGTPRDAAKAGEMLEQSKKLAVRRGMMFAQSLVAAKAWDDFAQGDLDESISAMTEKMQLKAQFDFAGTFADPKSKNYDPKEAVKWYEIAAEGGESWAMLSLAALYSEGRLGKAEPEKAFEWFKRATEKGDQPLAWANLAICYHNGLGVARSADKATEIFKAQRDRDLIGYLGIIGKCPERPMTAEQVLELTKSLAAQNDAHAQYLLGMRHLTGTGVKFDADDAERWFKKAAKSSHGGAFFQLGLISERGRYGDTTSPANRLKASLDYYKKGAAAGDADSAASLGDMYMLGRGVTQSDDQAVAFYEQCLQSKPDHTRAHNNLARTFTRQQNRFDPSSTEREELVKKIMHHYREADRLGLSEAAFNLGMIALSKNDFQTAYVHFDTAASRGNIAAHAILGEMHEKGTGVPVTLREAAYHYRLAALGGDIESLKRLCDFYLKGKGVTQDYDRAGYWLRLLAMRGHLTAWMALGDLLLRKGEYAAALKFFSEVLGSDQMMLNGVLYDNSVMKGYAYERLAHVYENGFGVTKDPRKAARYREKALALGNDTALYGKAMSLIREKKWAEAMPLLEKAAAANLPAANYSLGVVFMKGESVPADLPKGWTLLRKAADLGSIDAQYLLAASHLTRLQGAPELAEALRFAEAAEAAGHSKAAAIRKKLEEKRANQTTTESAEKARAL